MLLYNCMINATSSVNKRLSNCQCKMIKKVFVTFCVGLLAYWMLQTNKKKLNPDDVKNLRVVVTGASSGIGEQISYQLAAMGARLLVTARTESKLKQVVEKCKKLGSPDAYYIPASMYSYANASLVITTALENLGGIDVLVLNHIGQTTFGGYQYDVKHLESLLMSNTLTHAHMASTAMETLKSNNGRVIVISSTIGLLGGPYLIPYATTKHALNGFFRSLRLELQLNNTDVSISLCHLGFIGTKSALRFKDRIREEPASPEDCAAEIIRGGMAREEDVFFPPKVAFVPASYALFPNYINKAVQDTYIKLP